MKRMKTVIYITVFLTIISASMIVILGHSFLGSPKDEISAERASKEYDLKEHKSGLITFILDDGKVPQYEKLLPLFEEYEMVANWSLATGLIGQDDEFVTWDEIDEAYKMGWEISSHSATHPDMRKLSPSEVEAELKKSKEALKRYAPVAFVYPYYLYNEEVVDQVQAHYELAFAGSKNPYDEGRNTGYEGVESTDNINTRAYIQANKHTLRRVTLTGTRGTWMGGRDKEKLYRMVDKTMAKDGWLVFTLHDANAYSMWRLGDLLDYIADKEVQVDTSRHGIKKFLDEPF